MSPDDTNPEQMLRSAQLEELRLKNEKLQLELNELRKGKPWHQILIQFVPVVTALIAFAGFFWGLLRYQEQSRSELVSHEREFMKPWIENQRDIYRKALSAAGTAANTENDETRRKAAEEFWQLYHGEMILVETTSVSDAMVAFGKCLERSKKTCEDSTMNDLSHKLGTAMHDSMAATAAMTFEKFASEQFKYK